MIRFLQWLWSLIRTRSKAHPQIILMDAPAPMHPLVRHGLEKERQQRILRTLRAYYSQRPRPWRGHQKRALARKAH